MTDAERLALAEKVKAACVAAAEKGVACPCGCGQWNPVNQFRAAQAVRAVDLQPLLKGRAA